MRTVLICHHDDLLNREGLSRWLASFSDLRGIVVLEESRGRMWKRIRREIRRVGAARFLDVLAFRAYYRLARQRRDARWEEQELERLCSRFAPVPAGTQWLHTHSPNTPEAERFIREAAPDIMIARCKTLLKESIFSVPTRGTFVMHPGICPEYRNAHGCFWALAQRDLDRVGMTLLRIDKGVDTGPVYGQYGCSFDETRDSHIVIQHKTVLENLDVLQGKLTEIYEGGAMPIDTRGRSSGEWGQPWLSAYLKWQRIARHPAAKSTKGEIHAPHASVP